MKLDATDLRYLSADEFRVLRAAETGSKHHEVVPATVIAQLSGLRHGGINKIMGALAKRNLIAREQNIKYDGYRLTYGGYDFLAVRALSQNEQLVGVGTRVGVGKESDIYLAQVLDEEHPQAILKVHRLGRISFRAVKEKRDYMGKRKSASWMYMSRLAAAKEYAFMQILHQHGFPVPTPLAQSRHAVLMSLIPAYPLRQIAVLPAEQIPLLYGALMRLIVRLARAGLIHGDFNEFNLLIREIEPPADEENPNAPAVRGLQREVERKAAEEESSAGIEAGPGEYVESGKGFERLVAVPETGSDYSESDEEDEEEEQEAEGEIDEQERIHMKDGSTVEPVLIDFPQMVSVEHENAEFYFDRDVQCIRRFFRKRFRFTSSAYPRFRDVVPANRAVVRAERERRKEALLRGEEVEGEDLGVWHTPAAGEGEGEGEEDGELLELDVLAAASGVGGKKGKDVELEEYMSRLRTDDAADSASEEEEEEGEDEVSEEDEEANEVDASADASPLDADDALTDAGTESSRLPLKSRLPSRGAATKAAAEGDARGIAARIAAERERASRKAAKHHGRKAHAGKAGRTHAGGKAKGDAVRNDGAF